MRYLGFSKMTSDRASTRRRRHAELDRVTVTTDVNSDGSGMIPAGSEGTVVAIWDGGRAYEIEFTVPIAGLATVPAANVQALRPAE